MDATARVAEDGRMVAIILLVIPFLIPGLLIAAGANYIAALAVGMFLLICIGKGLE